MAPRSQNGNAAEEYQAQVWGDVGRVPAAAQTTADVVQGSGWGINLRRESGSPEPSRRVKHIGRAQAWQYDTEYWMGELGVVWYAHNYVGNAIGRGVWRVGWVDDSGDLLEAMGEDGTLAPGVDEALYAAAADALDRITGPGGQADWSRPMGTQVSSVAESYLIGYSQNDDGDPVEGELPEDLGGGPNPEAATEVWEAYSPTAVRKEKDDNNVWRWKVKRTSIGEYEMLPSDAMACRVWRYGNYPDEADGPMRPLVETCEDMDLLRKAIRGSALSRTHAGLLLIAQESLGAPMPAASTVVGGQIDGRGSPVNPVVTEIISGMSTPARDPGSAASLVPTPVTLKGDWVDKGWKHLPLSRDIDPQLALERTELLRTFAQGNEMPPEVILGMADLNHWTAWQVGADAWRHIEPTVLLIGDGVTRSYMWPSMRATLATGTTDEGDPIVEPDVRAKIQRFKLLFDETKVLQNPDNSAKADAAFDHGAISWSTYRKAQGFDEDDAPSRTELEARLELGYAKGRPPPDVAAAAVGVAPSTPEAATPSTPPPAAARAVVTASAAPKPLADLPMVLARLDMEHLNRTVDLVESAVHEAVAQAGAQLRSAAQKDPSLRAIIKGLPASEVGSRLGVREVGRLLQHPSFEAKGHETLEHLFSVAVGAMLVRYASVTTAVHAAYAKAVTQYTGTPLSDVEAAEMQADAIASEHVLRAGVNEAARSRLFGAGTDAMEQGEAPAGITVPTSVARRASERAGGVSVQGSTKPLAQYEGGIATGPHRLDQLQTRGLVKTGLLWVYGTAPRVNSFPDHEDLDGMEFDGPDDGNLDVTPWGMAYPGDHSGCLCTWTITFAGVDTGEEADDSGDVEDAAVTDEGAGAE